MNNQKTSQKTSRAHEGYVPALVRQFELDFVDDDIADYFREDFNGRYVPTLPVLLQISRQLRKLLEQGNGSQNGSDNSESSENDVQPKNAI